MYADGNSPAESEKLVMFKRKRIVGALFLSRRER